ncbi:MAG: hypothetical protein WAU39_06155 [Polyangiales bacterium]
MAWWLTMAGVLLAASPAAAQGVNADTVADTGPPPKVAVVVAGDPDDTLRDIASFLETESKVSGLRTPTDPALSAAMRGEPPAEEDGLEGLRSIRRGLGLDPRKDLASYQRIGMIAGADALIVVRRQGVVVIEVFDVSAGQFYEGTLAFDQSTSEQRVRFVRSRAVQARLRWSEPPSVAPAAAAPPASQTEGEKDEAEESRAKRRWKKAWPYVVAGALLAGGVTYLIIDRRRTNEVGPPLLRFRPGEE